MKDATGELSMTAIAVVAIAAIGVLFSTLIWPTIKQNISRSTYCSQAFNCVASNSGKSLCYYCTDDACSTMGSVYCQSGQADATTKKAN